MTTENELIFAKAARGKSFRAKASTDIKPDDYPTASTMVVKGRRWTERHRVFAFAHESELTGFLAKHTRAKLL